MKEEEKKKKEKEEDDGAFVCRSKAFLEWSFI